MVKLPLTKIDDGIDCEGELFFYCESCEALFSVDDANSTDDGMFCEECFSEKFTECTNCHNIVKMDNAISTANENLICERCYSDDYFTCDACSEIYLSNRANETDNGDYECDNCYRQPHSDQIHDYSWEPSYQFYKERHENTVYLGIELEVNTPSNVSAGTMAGRFIAFLKSKGWDKYIYLKEDCSIGNGFEIVTHPMTLQAIHKRIKWSTILEWLRKAKCSSQRSGKCGLHVHVSKDKLNVEAQGKIKLFITANADRLIRFSKRGDMHYCNIHSYTLDKYKEDIKETFIPIDQTTIRRKYKRISQSEDRYSAINLYTEKPTIEYRLFRGTLGFERFQASLQFSEACTLFCKEWSALRLSNGTGWPDFKAWLRRSGRYSHLVKYLAKHSI